MGRSSVGKAPTRPETWDSDPAVTVQICEEEIEFNPASFKSDIEEMVSERRYADAIATLMLTSTEALVELQSERSYFAIDKCSAVIDPRTSVLLPGTDRPFALHRDWVMPDSGYDSLSHQWDTYSRIFARRYNKRVEAKFGRAEQ
ncbi:MAG: hypothetical protein AAGA30_15330 [Planctomycetota bacterium]